MPVFDIASSSVLWVSCFLFTGFIAVFVLPDLAMSAFFPIPRTIQYISRRQLHGRALWALVRNLVFWLTFIGFLYALAFLFDQEIGWFLLTGPVALVCWLLGLLALTYALFFKKAGYLDTYFMGIYMAYATYEEIKRYQGFIEHVEKLSIAEAKEELADSSLSFLEQKALKERILMLNGPNRGDY